MLRRISILAVVLECIFLLSECSYKTVPNAYLLRPRDLSNDITGRWITISYHSPSDSVYRRELSGELISMQGDSMYILSKERLTGIQTSSIDTAVLFVFRNQAGYYAIPATFMLLQNGIASIANQNAGFLLISIPFTLTAACISIYESASKHYKLVYPKYCGL